MKKQAVFIYDPKSKKMVEVCDVRSLTSEQFESFVKVASENVKAITQAKKDEESAKEQAYQETIENLQSQIDELKRQVNYLLGEDQPEEESNEQ